MTAGTGLRPFLEIDMAGDADPVGPLFAKGGDFTGSTVMAVAAKTHFTFVSLVIEQTSEPL